MLRACEPNSTWQLRLYKCFLSFTLIAWKDLFWRCKSLNLFTYKVFNPCTLLSPLLFSIIPMAMVWIMNRTEKNNEHHGLKNVTCRQTLRPKVRDFLRFTKFAQYCLVLFVHQWVKLTEVRKTLIISLRTIQRVQLLFIKRIQHERIFLNGSISISRCTHTPEN